MSPIQVRAIENARKAFMRSFNELVRAKTQELQLTYRGCTYSTNK